MLPGMLEALRARLDVLREGKVPTLGFWEKARFRGSERPSLQELDALDAELDRVGIHTAPDAELLRGLKLEKGRAAALARGLAERAERVLRAFDAQLRWLELERARNLPPTGDRAAIERAYVKLARVVRVADIFSRPLTSPPVPFQLLDPQRSETPAPQSARVATAQFFAARARRNAEDVVQKRRDLDVAQELLLRMGFDRDRSAVRQLRSEVAARREEARAAPQVRSVEELVRAVRRDARRQPGMAYQAFRGLYIRALEAENGQLAEAAGKLLSSLAPKQELLRHHIENEHEREAEAWLGDDRKPASGDPALESLTDLAFDLTGDARETFELAAGCARYFDVEDVLGEEVTELDLGVVRAAPIRVPYPTQTMTFETTGSLSELHNFVLDDPRMLLYDLASSRQRVRSYLQDAPPPRRQRKRRTAVRVYVCDASGSMQGARARFRDALILAELNNLRRKVQRGEPFDPLYFSFFNDTPTQLARVDTAAEASRQMEKLFEDSPAEGLTNITLALMAAFDSIHAAQGKDPYLARATVVLVTDGEDRVDMEVLRKTRAPVESLDIALSFISLGEENKDLRSLVDEQRQLGGRAFYSHLSDAEIASARTDFDSRYRTLWPESLPLTPSAWEGLKSPLEALERVARGRPAGKVPRTAASFDAFFPAVTPKPPADPGVRRSADRVEDILAAIAEAAPLTGSEERARESVTLAEHLLKVYEIPIQDYLGVLGLGTGVPGVQRALERVRLVAEPLG